MKYYISILVMLFLVIGCNKRVTKNSKVVSENLLISYNVLVDEEQSDYDVWTVNVNTGEKTNVTNHNKDVAWSYIARKGKIFFISDRDTLTRYMYLYTMNPDGSDVKKITNFRLTDSWMDVSDKKEEIIIKPHPKVDSAFYVINYDGKILNKIYTGLKTSMDPHFSPDESKIVFRGGNKSSKREEGFNEGIYIINRDGTNLTRLTNYPKNDTTAPWFAYKAGPPKWHPKEDFISYASFQKGKYSLYGVSPDGRKNWKLFDNKMNEVYHDWSSDGKWLVTDLSDTLETKFNIGLINWKTKSLKVLTDSTYSYQQAPSFIYE